MVGLFNTVLEMSVRGGIVILAVMLVRLFLLNAPKKYSYFLWLSPLFQALLSCKSEILYKHLFACKTEGPYPSQRQRRYNT